MKIPFNIPPVTGKEKENLDRVINNSKSCRAEGPFSRTCTERIEQNTGTRKAILTTSCTYALEMVALLLDIKPGDEIIMPRLPLFYELTNNQVEYICQTIHDSFDWKPDLALR